MPQRARQGGFSFGLAGGCPQERPPRGFFLEAISGAESLQGCERFSLGSPASRVREVARRHAFKKIRATGEGAELDPGVLRTHDQGRRGASCIVRLLSGWVGSGRPLLSESSAGGNGAGGIRRTARPFAGGVGRRTSTPPRRCERVDEVLETGRQRPCGACGGEVDGCAS